MNKANASQQLRATLALAGGVLIIGFSAIFIRLAGAPGTISAFYRMLVGAAIIAVPFVGQTSRTGETTPIRGVLWATLGGMFIAGDMALWSTGIMLSGATITTLINNIAPLWVGLGAWLFFGERHKTKFWLGLSIAVIGISTIFGPSLISTTHRINIGAVTGLVSSFFYAAYFLATQRGRTYINTLAYYWIATFSAAVSLLLINIILGQPFTGYSPQTWLTFLAMGILVQIGGWMLINYAQGYLPAAIISPTLLGQPVLTAIFAVPLLGEHLTTTELTGGAAVLLGIYLVHQSRNP